LAPSLVPSSSVSYPLSLHDALPICAMGTGFAIGKPGEPVEYIVTNGHVVEYGYMGPKVYAEQVSSAGVQVYFSAAENDYVTAEVDRKSTRLNSSHVSISYAVFCLKK